MDRSSARLDLERRVRAFEYRQTTSCPLTARQREAFVSCSIACISDDDVAVVERALLSNPSGYAAIMEPHNDTDGMPAHPLFDVLRVERRTLLEPAFARMKWRMAAAALSGDGVDFVLTPESRAFAEWAFRVYEAACLGFLPDCMAESSDDVAPVLCTPVAADWIDDEWDP